MRTSPDPLVGALARPEVAAAASSGDVTPAPPSIGAAVPLTYFGPRPPQRELVGPLQLLTSGPIDLDAGTITIPLYQGQLQNGKKVWYVLTDTSDKENAEALGLLFSAKLHYAATGNGARAGRLEKDASLTFAKGAVDFRPERKVVPRGEPNLFPPKTFQPGSVGCRSCVVTSGPVAGVDPLRWCCRAHSLRTIQR